MELTVIEQNGWKKPNKFEKVVVRIGSASTNDIQLSSPGIAPIHLQVIHDPQNPGICKVLNLGPAVVLVSAGKETSIGTGTQSDARDGDELALAEYHILFNLPLASRIMQTSHQIAASLSTPDAVLHPEYPATAILHLQNLGDHPNCQFQVVVNGLSAECFRVDPLPILYPGAEEDVRIQFFHRSVTPPAGYHHINVAVTAPLSYPGEQVILQQELYVTPSLQTGLRVKDDMQVSSAETPELPPLPEVPPLPEAGKPAEEPVKNIAQPTLSPVKTEEMHSADVPTVSSSEAAEPQAADILDTPEPAVLIQKENTTPKVVRNPSETFWDEGS
jgi:hypothetical protein